MKLPWVGEYYSYIIYQEVAIVTCWGEEGQWVIDIRNMPNILPVPMGMGPENIKAVDQKVASILQRYWEVITEDIEEYEPDGTECPVCSSPPWAACTCR